MKKYPTYLPKYNPKKDIKRVSPFGALDLKAAFANNTIPSTLETIDGKFNGVDNPDAISTRVRDRIDGEVLHNSIKNYVPESNDKAD